VRRETDDHQQVGKEIPKEDRAQQPSLELCGLVVCSARSPGLPKHHRKSQRRGASHRGCLPRRSRPGYLGTITTYVQTTPGTYGIIADSAGTKQTLVSAQGTLLNGGQYTVLIGNYLNSLQEIILKDQSTPAPSGQMNVRFLDQSTTTGAIDLYLVPSGATLVTVKPVITNITFNVNSGYFNVPAGTYTLVALPTGTVPTATTTSLYTGASVTYSSGAARTFILIDQQVITNPGVQVVTGDDYDSPTATS